MRVVLCISAHRHSTKLQISFAESHEFPISAAPMRYVHAIIIALYQLTPYDEAKTPAICARCADEST